MRLLFDENLSPQLPAILSVEFPNSQHVRDVGLKSESDFAIWEYAAANSLTIVTKDDDFRQLAVAREPPPKVIWLTVGNCSTRLVVELLRQHLELIKWFETLKDRALITLDVE